MADEKYRNIPHVDLVVENGDIVIPSIFMFKGGAEEYYSFLRVCSVYHCTVHFKNEKIAVEPDNSNMARHMKETLYFQMAVCPDMVEQYLRFLLNSDKMSWDAVQGQHEAIL